MRFRRPDRGVDDVGDVGEVAGLLTVAGGKYTTYRVMARDAVDAVLGAGARTRPSRTHELPITGAAPRPELDAMAARLAECGLYPKEARAMVNTWRTSYYHAEGVRALFVLPQSWTDGFIPLQMYPKPKELVRVMARGFAKRTLDAAAQAAALATCRRLAKRIDAAAPEGARAALPRCGDPDDQKFLEAALAANAQFLITKDRKLLALARKSLPFRIVRPGDFPK